MLSVCNTVASGSEKEKGESMTGEKIDCTLSSEDSKMLSSDLLKIVKCYLLKIVGLTII